MENEIGEDNRRERKENVKEKIEVKEGKKEKMKEKEEDKEKEIVNENGGDMKSEGMVIG